MTAIAWRVSWCWVNQVGHIAGHRSSMSAVVMPTAGPWTPVRGLHRRESASKEASDGSLLLVQILDRRRVRGPRPRHEPQPAQVPSPARSRRMLRSARRRICRPRLPACRLRPRIRPGTRWTTPPSARRGRRKAGPMPRPRSGRMMPPLTLTSTPRHRRRRVPSPRRREALTPTVVPLPARRKPIPREPTAPRTAGAAFRRSPDGLKATR
jgi:hypothetical protein